MIDGLFKRHIDPLWESFSTPLVCARVTPNQVTATGLVLICLASLAYLWHGNAALFGVTLAVSFAFDALDGEGIMLDGEIWQARSDGSVTRPPDDALVPFWVATHFVADARSEGKKIGSWAELVQEIDALRSGENISFAIRVRGQFRSVKYRTACRAEAGESLVEATSHQAEFSAKDVSGTLIGFWTPMYAKTINVPGYHLHLLSDDRRHGGHILDLEADAVEIELATENHLSLALPETAAFLQADLTGDPVADLAKAEGDHE